MRIICHIWIFLVLGTGPLSASVSDSLKISGQWSTWGHLNTGNELPVLLGGRYIPQVNYSLAFAEKSLFDMEASANLNASMGFHPFDTIRSEGRLKPYRLWLRYSTNQFEARLGLQKINFGSASMLRPLMWFDQIDPRDPLQLTDGVWGLLTRYYFLNNANIWFWVLYGNEKPKTWELGKTNQKYPETGGRIQIPVPAGETALSYHFRNADTRSLEDPIPGIAEINEHRIGLDGKFDLVAGIWFEGVWIHKNKDLGVFSNQEIFNLGTDYTFGVGNGLYMCFEQLVVSNDEKAFGFANTLSFSGLSVSYPLGFFNNLGAIVFYDWTNDALYNFFTWKTQLNKISLYFMAYRNPQTYRIPLQGDSPDLFAGKGIQIMMVFNH